mgnify:CR=1 FL=1
MYSDSDFERFDVGYMTEAMPRGVSIQAVELMNSDEKSKFIILLQQMLEDSRERVQASEQRAERARAIARENRVRIEEMNRKIDELMTVMNELLASNRIKDNKLAEQDRLIAELRKALSDASVDEQP